MEEVRKCKFCGWDIILLPSTPKDESDVIWYHYSPDHSKGCKEKITNKEIENYAENEEENE